MMKVYSASDALTLFLCSERISQVPTAAAVVALRACARLPSLQGRPQCSAGRGAPQP